MPPISRTFGGRLLEAQAALRSTCVFESTRVEHCGVVAVRLSAGFPDTELNVRFVMPNG
jgi:hypothetical protein